MYFIHNFIQCVVFAICISRPASAPPTTDLGYLHSMQHSVLRTVFYGGPCLKLDPVWSGSHPVHTYGTLLDQELTYISLRPEQLSSNGVDMLQEEEDEESVDKTPRSSVKPQRTNKGTAPSPPVEGLRTAVRHLSNELPCNRVPVLNRDRLLLRRNSGARCKCR